MAPEIMCTSSSWDPAASDVWSLGVVLMEMMCGNYSFNRLLGWKGRDLIDRSIVVHRAHELAAFFAKDEAGSHANALRTIHGLCCDMPPPFAMNLLGRMLEI